MLHHSSFYSLAPVRKEWNDKCNLCISFLRERNRRRQPLICTHSHIHSSWQPHLLQEINCGYAVWTHLSFLKMLPYSHIYQHGITSLTPVVANLCHTASIQTATKIVYAFPKCWFVHIQYIPRNFVQVLVSHRTKQTILWHHKNIFYH